jgi:glycosyltransferase involved in cell wall biosynthesis
MSPRVSVVMAVYNGEKYLREALDSILAQTFTDFEFIIVNDGSTDATSHIIKDFDDDRIRLIQNELNIGLTLSLNRGLEVATGEYIARMDSDDISLPVRLAKQVAFMDANQRVGACGTWALEIDRDGKIIGKRETLVGCQLDNFYWRTSLIHSTSMFRFTPSCGPWYDPTLRFSQDYDLWLRISTERKLSNLAEHLLLYRVHDESITAANADNQMDNAYRSLSKHIGERVISFEAFKALMGYSYDLHPIRRIFATMCLAKRLSKPYRAFFNDDVEYLRHWSQSHGPTAQSFEALAFKALRYIKRQTSFRLS